MISILNPIQGTANYTVCFADTQHAYDVQFNNVRSEKERTEIWDRYAKGRNLPASIEAIAIVTSCQQTTGPEIIPDRRTPVEKRLQNKTKTIPR